MDRYINKFYLDNEKDIVVSIYEDNIGLFYVISTPNHHTGNLITNLAKLAKLNIKKDSNDMKYIKDTIVILINRNNDVFFFI